MRVFQPSDPVMLVDLDGVSVDFFGGLQGMLSIYHGTRFEHIPPEKCTKFIVQDLFEGDFAEMAHRYPKEPGFFRGLPPVEGAIEALREMADLYPTHLCTSPYNENRTCGSDKINWVRQHLGEEWLQRLHIVADKTFVRGAFLLDDKPVLTGHFKPTWKHLLFDNGCAYCGPRCGVTSINWNNWREVLQREVELWRELL